MTPLKVYGVLAPEAAPYRRIAGGTAEGMPFVPIVGGRAFIFYIHTGREKYTT